MVSGLMPGSIPTLFLTFECMCTLVDLGSNPRPRIFFGEKDIFVTEKMLERKDQTTALY